MSEARFRESIRRLSLQIADRPLDAKLDEWLNATFPPGSPTYDDLQEACKQGVAEGWLCNREADGIKYGRVFKPADDLNRFSVDVVEMDACAGPHHVHPNGEIDLIMPIDGDALFDGRPAGWCVYPPGSAHRPTVTRGRSLVLYLLPEGKIEFTKAA